VLGWLKGAVLVALICWLFPGKPHPPRELAPLAPMSRDEKRLAWLLAVVLTLWVTESWHGVGPAWTGLAAAVVTLLPRVGFISGEEFASGVNMRTCIYVAGILGLAITVTQTGIGGAVGNALLQVMPLDKDNPFTSFLALTGITSALNFIMTANGVPALYTTFAQSFADATGFPLLSVIMIQVLGYSTPLLPYQASPIVVAMGLGKVPARAGMLLCLALAAVSYLILLPLDYAWYQLLGKL
ncbi:anion permease, partial [Klebsiella aerogenes]|nr:anion permease [Klebsiella aerogenes]